MTSALLPRSFRRTYPQAVRGEGCYVFTADGNRYLDAAGGAAVVTIGHGVAAIGRAMARQAAQLGFVHTSQFHTEAAEQLAWRLRALCMLRSNPWQPLDGERQWAGSAVNGF